MTLSVRLAAVFGLLSALGVTGAGGGAGPAIAAPLHLAGSTGARVAVPATRDPCLIATWIETTSVETYYRDMWKGKFTPTSSSGRETMRFRKNGTVRVSAANFQVSGPYSLNGNSVQLTITISGSFTARWGTTSAKQGGTSTGRFNQIIFSKPNLAGLHITTNPNIPLGDTIWALDPLATIVLTGHVVPAGYACYAHQLYIGPGKGATTSGYDLTLNRK